MLSLGHVHLDVGKYSTIKQPLWLFLSTREVLFNVIRASGPWVFLPLSEQFSMFISINFLPPSSRQSGKSTSGLCSNITHFWWLAFAFQWSRQDMSFCVLVQFCRLLVLTFLPKPEQVVGSSKSKSYPNSVPISLEPALVFLNCPLFQSSTKFFTNIRALYLMNTFYR